jgi:hypothetical protein
MNGGSKGVVACGTDSSSRACWFALAMSIGRAPDSLRRSSKIVLAGEGGTWEDSPQPMGPAVVGLAANTEADELVLERICGEKESPSGPSDTRLERQRFDMVEMREPMRESPFAEALSERLFLGEWIVSIPASVKS